MATTQDWQEYQARTERRKVNAIYFRWIVIAGLGAWYLYSGGVQISYRHRGIEALHERVEYTVDPPPSGHYWVSYKTGSNSGQFYPVWLNRTDLKVGQTFVRDGKNILVTQRTGQ